MSVRARLAFASTVPTFNGNSARPHKAAFNAAFRDSGTTCHAEMSLAVLLRQRKPNGGRKVDIQVIGNVALLGRLELVRRMPVLLQDSNPKENEL